MLFLEFMTLIVGSVTVGDQFSLTVLMVNRSNIPSPLDNAYSVAAVFP
jgi:hypothetical protein